jgi:glutathione S-transferase
VAPLFPATGGARWRALRQQALADGIMDAAVGRRGEMGKPQETARTASMERQRSAVARGVAALEADPPSVRPLTIGVIAVACALGYLNFRFGHEPWRDGNPRLAVWLAPLAEQPWFARTVPKDPA